MHPADPIFCEIISDHAQADNLARVVSFCAKQTGFTLDIVARGIPDSVPVVTLHLNARQAAPDQPVWCLVCRLACLCPQARVGTLIRAADRFAGPRPTHERCA